MQINLEVGACKLWQIWENMIVAGFLRLSKSHQGYLPRCLSVDIHAGFYLNVV